jgi:uncharacterized protein YqhQ
MAGKFRYGGQAVMEGVMMRGQKTIATAVRRPNGEVAVQNKPLSSLYTGWVRRAPFIRGVIVLLESLVLGIGSLIYSANVALEEENEKISGGSIWLILLFSSIFAISLFFLAPLFFTKLLDPYISSSLVFHLIEGGIRLAIFLAYLWLISLMPDIKRTFAYHGAEHKTINAYEHGEPLEPRAISKYSTAHGRCGTAFLLAVLIIAILVFALIGRQDVWLMILSRVLLLPVIASLGYEVTQFSARHSDNVFARVIMAPGLWLQKMTTREPDDRQVEVAIAALESVLASDQEPAQASSSSDSL